MCNGALSQGGPMEYKHRQQATRSWTTRRDEMKRRMQLVSSWMSGPLPPRERPVEAVEVRGRHCPEPVGRDALGSIVYTVPGGRRFRSRRDSTATPRPTRSRGLTVGG